MDLKISVLAGTVGKGVKRNKQVFFQRTENPDLRAKRLEKFS